MKLIQRILATALTLALLVGLLPAQAAAVTEAQTAAVVPTEKPTTLQTGSGETVEVDDEWETKYPYGAFVFAACDATLAEGGDALTVPVYRMGGVTGRATVYILFNPMQTTLDEEGATGSGSAAGFDDLTVEAEDTLPIARYQALGKEPDPESGTATIVSTAYTGEGAEDGDLNLTLDAAAERWQWQVLYNGAWQRIEDGAEDHLVIGAADRDAYDFRCVYTVGGEQFCSVSLHGEAYKKPAPEVLEPAPADIDLAPEQSFTAVQPEGDDPTAPAVFALTFADGEWVKYLRLTATEDDLAEPTEFATLTMLANEGGDLFQSAGTLILSVLDNDDPEPFTLGFELTEIEADKADGTATLTVVRSGGGQTPVTVSYATADGTALAGRDYEAAEGELFFYADFDRQTIEIPLIDDGAADGAPRSFTVTLGEIKGNGAGLGSLENTTATVELTNSGTAQRRNLATVLAVTNRTPDTDDGAMLRGARNIGSDYDIAADASARAVIGGMLQAGRSGPIGGTQVTTEDDALMQGSFNLAAPQAGANLQTYQYGEITFAPQPSVSQYWSGYAYIAGHDQADYTGWSGGSASDAGWLFKSTDKGTVTLNIPHMSQYFYEFSGTVKFNPEWSSDWVRFWCDPPQYVYGTFEVQNKTTTCLNESGCTDNNISYYSSRSVYEELDIADTKHNTVALHLIERGGHSSDEPAWVKVTEGTLSRREFANNLKLTIHTANDGESGGGNVHTAPAGMAELKADTGVYESMKPVVTVVPNAGGVTSRGKLYVGSKIKVSLQNTASYFPYSGEEMNTAVYLTRSDGSVVNAKVERSGNDYFITLFWDTLGANDLSDRYTINVVMTRKQEVHLDLSPSVDRRTDKDGKPTAEIDAERVPDALSRFWSSGGNYITIGRSVATAAAPHFRSTIQEENIYRLDGKSNDPLKSLGTLENVQYINFRRSQDDIIVFHGKAYAGNADIVLSAADLASGELTFLYYNKDYIASESVMTAAVESVAIYWDGNCNNAIDGHYDTATGYFVLDEASGDSLYFYMDKDESLCETFFQPTKDERGTHEFIAKIFYTMTPRSYNNPAGETGAAAQVLPALTTTVTDPAHYGALTEAQQSYRYLKSGKRADGSYTADGHPMYGPEASAVQYVDVPLGGDHSPAGDDGSGRMAWTPDYHGHLLTDFADPEPIILEHSLMGDNYLLSDFSYSSASGSVTASNKALLNGYLGAFVGNSTIALCPMEQAYATPQLASHPDSLAPESSTLIGRSVYADPGDSTALSTTSQPEAGFSEMSDNPFPEFGLSANLHNSGFNASFPAYLGLASFIYTKDAIQVVFSIPLVNWVKGQGVTGGPDFAGFKDQWNQFKQVKEAVDTFDGDALRSALETQDDDQAEGGSLRSGYFYVTLALTGTVTFKYNEIDNAFVLDNFGVGVVGGLYFRVQQRFTPFPLAYVFFTVNFEVTVIARFENMQTKILSDWPIAAQDEPMALDTGEVLEFDTIYVFMELAFRGKVYIEAMDPASGQPLETGKKGYLHGTGDDKLIKLATDPGPRYTGEKTVRVRITALEPTVISHAQTVRKFTRELRFAGLGVDPQLSLSGGVGIGITLVRIEAFLNLTVSAAMRFLPYDQTTGTRETFQFEQVSISVGLGVNISAIAFNFSFKPIEIVFTYDGIKREWKEPTWKSAFAPSNSLAAETGPQLPQDFSRSQSLRSPNEFLASTQANALMSAAQLDTKLRAYDTGAPFQVSGYGGSASAITLADGLASGYDYRVVTMGGENYVLYAVGNRGASALERSRLVLSRLVSTGSAPGLVNPLNAASATPYIVVDDDASGDLEWAAWADGNQIRIAWVSYGTAAQATQLQGLSAAALFQRASNSRVIKTAVFDAAHGITGIETVGGGTGDVVFLPAATGNAVAFVEADPMTSSERADARAKYIAALTAAGYDPNGTGGSADVGAYRLQTQEALWDVSGGVNRLTLWRSGAAPVRSELAPGVTVDNLQFTEISGDYYLAFTTTELVCLTADGQEALTADEVEDMATVRRLCLKRIGADGAMGTTQVLRTVYDLERDGAGTLNALFSTDATGANDPGFANLRFLNANLGSALGGVARNTAESFLLFEMSGNTYIVREDDLVSLAAGGTGTIRPFFTVNNAEDVTGATGFVGVTGVTGVTIGADGAGGLAAVYIAPVPGTTNNAVYLRQYDSALGWGEGVMLAMNHMDVYEQSIREGWDAETTEKAYIDKKADSFRFGSLQIAMGTASGPAAAGEERDKAEGTKDRGTTLLVLTQGTYDQLSQSVTGSGKYYPNSSANANHTGVYAVSYGMGHQALGEGSISFAGADFSAGALLHTAVKFKNTGDVAIRGSAANPITVRLMAEGEYLDSTTLAEWTVTQNILPGREVSLNGEFELPVTLPEGTALNLSVSEDAGYAGKPFAAVLQNLLTVKSVPELGFADGVKLTPVRSTTSGSAVYDVDFTIENRGNEYAHDILLQFSYDTGKKDKDGKTIYQPINISGNTLTVEDQAPLQLNAENPYRGLFSIPPISAGYCRRVTGTLKLSEQYFDMLRDGTAEIRVEIFSAADREKYYQDNMLYAKVREEYNTANNVAETSASHATFFYVPERLSIPLGVTLRLPLRYSCTDREPSHILVAEFPQTETAGGTRLNSSSRFSHMDQRISELYYEENAYTNGTGVGTVVITPMEEGISYIRVMDLQTNDFVDIACEVTPGEGLNVFSGATDSGLFSFRNAGGAAYDPGATGQSWEFESGVAAWGADGSVPYKQDLALGKPGASFLRTETVAESMKLVFNGTVRVESTLPGFEPVTLTAGGGSGRNASEAAVVVFGNKARMIPHTVTVTVTAPAAGKQYAEIDWAAEYYHGDSPFTLGDSQGPRFYWSSSFPAAGTVREPVSLTLHAVDDRGLTDLWVDSDGVADAGAVTKDGENHWALPLTVKQNGTVTIHARDVSGNHVITELAVDWFGNAMTSGIPALNISADWIKSGVYLMAGADGDGGGETRHLVVSAADEAPDDLRIAVSYLGTDENGGLTETAIRETPGTAGAYRAAEDGLYMVKAVVTGPQSTNSEYAYRIYRSDGSLKEEGNGASVSAWTTEIVRLDDNIVAEPEPSPAPYVPAGAPTETVKRTVGEDGTVAETHYSAGGTITQVKVTVSDEALETALGTGEVMPAPVTVPAGQSAAVAPVIHVEMSAVDDDIPVGALPRLAIPVTGTGETTVAFVRCADGSWTPVKDCYVEDGQLIVPVEGPCELVIADNAKDFPDVAADAWYAPYVDFVAARGIFNGTDRGFAPEGTMTRAMVAQVLYNLDRRSVSGIRADFDDVAVDAWYADAVGWAAEEGVIQGYGGAFSPDAPISRQDLVTILYRYAKAAGYPIAAPADFSDFTDAGDVADYAREAMGWAVAVGMICGMGDGTLAPGGTATRAQVAKIMQVFLTALR